MSHYTVIICYMSQLCDNYMSHYTVIICYIFQLYD